MAKTSARKSPRGFDAPRAVEDVGSAPRAKSWEEPSTYTRGEVFLASSLNGSARRASGDSMLTRLEVHGFKNLLDLSIDFGPFTCIAGENGTGKSNVFDTIHFLSLLADQSMMEAAQEVRGVHGCVRSPKTRAVASDLISPRALQRKRSPTLNSFLRTRWRGQANTKAVVSSNSRSVSRSTGYACSNFWIRKAR
ncbi:AAA family ATPase [Streptomyces sp. NPDC126503]|uniref:AAA family ATPase n=1 Tax=Streptomyces sp. NPDC126503 TaxID=3155315 RepID=UPI003322F221